MNQNIKHSPKTFKASAPETAATLTLPKSVQCLLHTRMATLQSPVPVKFPKIPKVPQATSTDLIALPTTNTNPFPTHTLTYAPQV